jgi:hypothetical protein
MSIILRNILILKVHFIIYINEYLLVNNKKYTFIRSQIYTNQRRWIFSIGEDLDNFKKYPYTCLKSRIYIEAAAMLVTLLQYTKIAPNQLTLFYTFLGPFSIMLTFYGTDISYFLALLNFVLFKGFIDWSDGALARIQNKCSDVGAILDPWGAHVNSYSFHICLGIFLFNISNNIIFIFTAMSIVFFRAIDIRDYKNALLGKNLSDEIQLKGSKENVSHNISFINRSSSLFNLYMIFTFILDDRARMVDSILFIFILDYLFVPHFFISSFIYFLILFSVLTKFSAGLYLVYSNKLSN